MKRQQVLPTKLKSITMVEQFPEFAALIDDYVKDPTISTGREQKNQQVLQIASIISSDNITLADVIEFMGQEDHKYLNSSIESFRNRATYLVANLIYKLNDGEVKYILHPSVLHILSVFFTRRLEDLPSTLPSLYALSTLIEFYSDNFDPKYFDFIDIAEAIFKGLGVQLYAQNIRQKVFSFYDEFLSIPTVTSILNEKDYGLLVLEGMISAIDSEKDPRCLLLALKVFAKAVQSFSYVLDESNHSQPPDALMVREDAHATTSLFSSSIQYPSFVLPNPVAQSHIVLAGKVFDSVACYFPITFTPPPDDPFGVAPEALISALQDSLCSHVTLLRHHTIPFMISQLSAEDESVLSIAREHSLATLIRAVSAHTHKILLSVSSSLQDNKKDSPIFSLCEILNTILSTVDCSPAIRSLSLKLIMEVTNSVTNLAAKENNNYAENDWTLFNDPLLQMIRKDIMECSDGMKAKCSVEIAFCMSSVNSISCKLVADLLLPILIEKARDCATLLLTSLQKQVSAAARGINILPSSEEKISSAPLEFIGRLMTATKISGRDKSINFSNLSWGDAVSTGDRVTLFSILANTLSGDGYDVSSSGTEDGNAKLRSFLPSGEISAFIAESVRTMQELLLSGSINDLKIDQLAGYIRTVALVAVYGVKKLWLSSQLVLVLPTTTKPGAANEAVSIACTNLLIALARSDTHTQLVANYAVPTLMQQYKTVGDHADGSLTLSVIGTVLSNVVRSSVGLSLLGAYIPSVIDSVAVILSEIEGDSSAVSIDNIRNLSLYLNSIASLMKRSPSVDSSSSDSDSANQREKALYLLEISNAETDSVSVESTRATISNSAVYKIIVRSIRIGGAVFESISVPSTEQEPIYNEFFSSLLTLIRQLLISLGISQRDQQIDLAWPLVEFITAEAASAVKEPLVTAVLCNILVAVQKESVLFSDDVDSAHQYSFHLDGVHILEYVASRAIQSLSVETHSKGCEIPVLATYSSAQLLAIIVNKVRVGGLLFRVVEQLQPLISKSKPSISHLFSFLWMMKGICMRPSIPSASGTVSLQEHFIQQIVGSLRLFRVPEGSEEDVEALFDYQEAFVVGLGLLTSNDDTILSTALHCNSFTFWKQKLWSILASQLLAIWKSGLDLDQQRRQRDAHSAALSFSQGVHLPSAVYCAIALYSMGSNLTPQILQPNLKDLTELVVHTLKTDPDPSATAAEDVRSQKRLHRLVALLQSRNLQMMQTILEIDSSAFSSHLNTIIPVLVHSAQHGASAAQRFRAAEALLSMTQLEYPRVHPYKKMVIKGLAAALDDRKAAVRYMAAKARNKWMVLK